MQENIFFSQANIFLEKIFQNLSQHNLSLKEYWDIDHICFRTSTEAEYQRVKKNLQSFSTLLIESPVNGRLITTFKLHKPIYYQNWIVDIVEVPAPKKGKIVPSGFEHIEVVCDEELSDLALKFDSSLVHTNGLSKDFNAELELNFGSENIKFHQISLESVIRLEANTKVFNALKDSSVLSKTKEFHPLICGTFPLGIFNDSSDVDIVLTFNNENDFKNSIQRNFAHLDRFALKDSGNFIFANFYCNDIPIKLFGHSLPSVKQNAFQYFQIEEKILKYASYYYSRGQKSKTLKDKIMAEKALGLKAEVAFAKVLQLVGDPYDELLKLNKVSITKLTEFLDRLS